MKSPHLLLAASFVGAALRVEAQATADDRMALFEIMRQRAIVNTREVFEWDQRRFENRPARSGSIAGTSRAMALEPENAATASDRLTAAIKTGLAGTEAGVTFAPFGLIDPNASKGFSLTLAALEKEMTRVGASYSRDLSKSYLSAADLGMSVCPFGDAEMNKLNYDLDLLRLSFSATCRDVVPLLKEPPQQDEQKNPNTRALTKWHLARTACGDEAPSDNYEGPAEGLTLAAALVSISDAITYASENRTQMNPNDYQRFQDTVASHQAHRDRLRTFRLPDGESCITEKQIEKRLLQARWSSDAVKIGISIVGDFYPKKSGFNPDTSTPLPKGEKAKWQGRGEISIERRRSTFTGSIGFGKAREDLKSDLRAFVAPALAITRNVKDLSNVALEDKDGKLNIRDGKIPPSLVLGLSILAEVALDRPTTQSSQFNRIEVMPFADFKVSDKLSLRVGAPFKWLTVLRKADAGKGITEVRGLQRSVPFTVVSVIKL